MFCYHGTFLIHVLLICTKMSQQLYNVSAIQNNKYILYLHAGLTFLSQSPVEWGQQCFSDVDVQISASVSVTLNTKGIAAENLFEQYFCFPVSLAFEFFYDLDLCSQGQAVREFGMGFLNFIKKYKVIFIKHVRKLH